MELLLIERGARLRNGTCPFRRNRCEMMMSGVVSSSGGPEQEIAVAAGRGQDVTRQQRMTQGETPALALPALPPFSPSAPSAAPVKVAIVAREMTSEKKGGWYASSGKYFGTNSCVQEYQARNEANTKKTVAVTRPRL